MITYSGSTVAGFKVNFHAVTLTDKQPHEVIEHVKQWIQKMNAGHVLDIKNITQVTDGRCIYTTIWYTELTKSAQKEHHSEYPAALFEASLYIV